MDKSRGSGLGSMRAVISGIGIAIAFLIAFVFPTTLATLQYLNQAHALSFKARLNAERLAKYIYSQDRLWRYQRIRLAELILLPDEGRQSVRQRIFVSSGESVLEDGPTMTGPVLRRGAPIVVMGKEVGRIELESPLTPFFVQTGLVAFFSFLFGCAAYLCLKVFPLRLLDRTVGELEMQNFRFDTALNNMIHGLTMFDGNHRLVVCNQRYRDLYGIPESLTQPGATLEEILTFRAHNETGPGEDPEKYKQRLMTFSREDRSRTTVFELKNGRSISMRRNPMPGGGWVAAHEDVTEQREAAARIAYLAHHDALTGLPNRVMLRERLNEALCDVEHGKSLAVLCLDLDNFKGINDTLGHPIGDALLKQVAERLRGCIRETDIVARMGGDEFTIVQCDSNQPDAAAALGSRLIISLSEPYEFEGQQMRVGTSVGVALAPNDGIEADNLLRAADTALYCAKAQGRGICRFFEDEMNERLQARRRMENDLRGALARGEFEMHYQPLLDLESGKIDGLEGLLRWNHPKRGWISPTEFVQVAEEIGVIVPIGEWALRQACSDAAALPENITIAVNLSPIQFRARNLVTTAFQALSASGLAPDRLELEITESLLLEDTDTALVMLHQLRSLGVRIAMDDFGTGYSSLSYLQKFPFDKIKVDRSFVQGIGTNASSEAVLRAVASLGASLGIRTTAEGVETEEQLIAVKAEGISQIQGYLVSPPRSIDEIRRLLRQDAASDFGAKSAACA
jgi:diguanylate cyclase (GGDEF)-like protein